MKLVTCVAWAVGVCAICLQVSGADETAKWDPRMAASTAVVDTQGVKWIDGKYLPIEGRWPLGDMAHYYGRLPDTLTTNVNGGVRSMRFHTAGLQFRFSTDSKFIIVKYVSQSHGYGGGANLTGVAKSGWDLYRFDAARQTWRFLTTSHNSSNVPGEANARSKRVSTEGAREFILDLPLYDGVESLAVGIDRNAKLEALGPRKSGVTKPVVFYGTSITHGASASRPGLAFVNLVGRRLDVPVYNLGFSGCGLMEYELSDVIARIDASCYVLDCLWNMNLSATSRQGGKGVFNGVARNYEPFIRNLRAKRPNVPIVMAGQCDVYQRGPNEKERFIKALYEKLIAEGWKDLYFLPSDKMHHDDLEGTVDGCHPNDWGMMTMAEAYGGAVREALKLK